jgi:hypothetical protein
MAPLDPPATFNVYTLIKQTGVGLSYVYVSTPSSINFGPGFYSTRAEAEQARTFELLKDTAGGSQYHVFELEIPNPARSM